MSDDNDKRFWAHNPDWTYGKKLVVLATDYDRLEAENAMLRRQNEQLREDAKEWERAARIAKERGRLTVVK